MKLSIVLTVFNKEQYLHNAFSALLGQHYTNDGDYEVLVVNDGSTDGSAVIVQEYAKSDSRVRVLTQKNQGLSMARNNGVDAAQGEYVWFVDADDTISKHAVHVICKAIENSPDIIPIYGRTEGEDSVRNRVTVNAKSGKDILVTGHWSPCGVFNVFRKAFLKENGLRFLPGIYHEDSEFTPRMLYVAKTVIVIPEVLYTVFRDPNSITQVPRAKRAFDYLIVADSLSRFVIDHNEDGTQIGRAIDAYTAQDINNAFSIITKNSKEDQVRFINDFHKKRNSYLRVLYSAPQHKYRIEAFLFKLFPKRYVGIYRLLKWLS